MSHDPQTLHEIFGQFVGRRVVPKVFTHPDGQRSIHAAIGDPVMFELGEVFNRTKIPQHIVFKGYKQPRVVTGYKNDNGVVLTVAENAKGEWRIRPLLLIG